ncbi:MAG: hypothetical protein ABSC91_02960 [Candidatus Bathyarchaeia archaeon]|jgi:hypothetical protein
MVKAFRLESTKEEILAKLEKVRDKGGGMLKKRPEEKLAYLRLLLFPSVFVEYTYLKKKGFMGPKVQHRSSTILMDYPNYAQKYGTWFPELAKDAKENNLIDIKEGHYLPPKGDADVLAAGQLEYAKTSQLFAETLKPDQLKKAMNLDTEPTEIQDLSSASVIYMPYWVAKLETPNTTRYTVYDRSGEEDKFLSSQMNTNSSFVVNLEEIVQEI